MSYRIAGFGWLPDTNDARDAHVRQPKVQQRLAQLLPRLARDVNTPARQSDPLQGGVSAAQPAGTLLVDLRRWCSPIEEQGPIGSCTANAVVGALEYFERRAFNQHVDASRLFLYRVTRRFLGWENLGDTGAFLRSTMKALRLFGVPPERYHPYDANNWNREPDAFLYSYAQNFSAVEYFRLEISIDHLKSCLDSGLPFVFGFACFSSIDDPRVKETGVVPYPGPDEHSVGGHAVMAIGYTASHVLFRNSWGSGWGDGGYGYLPWSYFDSDTPLADDCWALVNARFVPGDGADSDVSVPPQARAPRPSPARLNLTAPRTTVTRGRIEDDPTRPYMVVRRGTDPTRTVPLRLSAAGVVPRKAAAQVALARTDETVALTLRTIRLNESFEWSLFGRALNQLYVAAVVWDLSGQPPIVWPPPPIQALPGSYELRKGDVWTFVGDGLPLWGPRPVVGALNLRLIVMESDSNLRAIGAKIELLHKAVAESDLTSSLAALGAGIAAAATVGMVAQAAWALSGVIGKVLSANGDDQVGLFDGSWGVPSLDASRDEAYDQRGATVVLGLGIV